MPIRIAWDNFEIALMFEVYRRMEKGMSLSAAAQELSNLLRQKAVNQRIKIDEIFRNTNGMVFYLKRTEYLFTNGKRGLDGAQKNVVEMYELYQNNPQKYNEILAEAQRLVRGETGMSLVEKSNTERKEVKSVNERVKEVQDRFAQWMSARVTPAQLSEQYSTYKMIDEFCISRGLLRKSIFETIDVSILNKTLSSLQGNKVFKRKYRSYIALSAFRNYISFVKAELPYLQRLKESADARPEKEKPAPIASSSIETQRVSTQDSRSAQDSLVLTEPLHRAKNYEGEPVSVFRCWMQNNGMSERTSVVYSLALRQCSHFALSKGYTPVDFYQMENAEMASSCKTLLMEDAEFVAMNARRNNQFSACMTKYICYLQDRGPQATENRNESLHSIAVDPKWKEILEKDFPDGYILDDFLCQFQAAAMWQEHFGETCPLEGVEIDRAIAACGNVKDGRVFISNEEEGQLLKEIADMVADLLQTYSNIYTVQVYQRYREELMTLAIYTEKVMIQQVLQHAGGRFVLSYNAFFTKPGDNATVAQDCEKVLRRYGGAMPVQDVAKELWFIPYDTVYHSLSVNERCLNVATGTWMLVEHFPFTQEDATLVANMLNECFLSREYVLLTEVLPLIQRNLPNVADNVSSLNAGGLYNIVEYYLKDQFSFSKSIISPKGKAIDNRVLFRRFSSERNQFSLADLEAFASELATPIYWESTVAGGAVRISHNEFVNRSQIRFDVDAIDDVLEGICPGDYLSFYQVPKGMLVLLPSCGYPWNGYLLSSYVYGFSKKFHMAYNSLGKTGYYGAMVRRSCKELETYEDLIVRVLTDDDTWQSQTDALNLIVNQGYQATRKLKGIENMIARANQNKLNDVR